MLIKAPAKINLTLRIVSRRADGYHGISSIMRAVSLFDEVDISLRPGQAGQGDGSFGTWAGQGDGSFGLPAIRVRADMAGVPDGPGNLAYRAAEAAFAAWGRRGQDSPERTAGGLAVDISLKKNIPAAAGLAGGSADAAAVLLGLAKALWAGRQQGSGKPVACGENGEAAPTLADIAALGAGLGADVPFCVYACAAANPELGYAGAGAALAEGIGERISPLDSLEKAQALLVKPAVEIPTKEAYALFDARGAVAGGSDNDFEAACSDAWPAVGETLRALKGICAEEGAAGAKVQLSGSGPTVFAYFVGDEAGQGSQVGRGGSTYGAGRENGPLSPGTAERVYARAKAAFPGMFVYLAETI